jgi:hypothetical protein
MWFAAALLLLATATQAWASHAMGADLTYTCLGGNQYRVRLSFYRDCSGITPSSSITIPITSASCGQSLSLTLNQQPGYPVEVSPLCAAQLPSSTCNGGTLPGVQEYLYEGTITLPAACTDWVMSHREGNRNASITTISNPGSAWLYVEATLNNVAAPCNSSPDFTSLPVPYICAGQPYIYNHGAVDPDGDVLVYSLIDALDNTGTSVTYNAGFSGTNPLSSAPPVAINASNGNVTMQPTGTQIAVIAVLVQEFRNGVLIGSTVRDIQVTVLNCSNNTPTISPITGVTGATQLGPYSIEICPGNPLSFTIPGVDTDGGQTITWSWNNGIPGGVFTAPTGSSPQNATFSWTPTGADVGLNSLTVTLQDNACPVLGQVTRAIDINVIQGAYAGPDQVYCTAGGPVPLTALGGTAWTWSILSGSAGSLSCTNCQSPSATPSVTTTYVVQSNLSGPCKTRDTVVVSVAPSFTLAMGPTQTICLGGNASLSATPSPAGSYTYTWSPATNLSSSTVGSPLAGPSSNTTYNVSVTSAAGCRLTGSQTVNVVQEVLSAAPTANPTISCAGNPVTLTANQSSDACARFTLSSIPYVAPPAGGTPIAIGDDIYDGPFNIGFNFGFSCNTYTQVYISTNGFISFDPLSGSGCCSGQILPDAGLPNNLIAAAWDDLSTGSAGSITYQTLGVAPNRRFVVKYVGVPILGNATPDVTSTIILYETSNIVEIHNTGVSGVSPATQGIENAAGTIAYVVPGRNSSTWTATNDAYRFTPTPPAPITVNWQSPLGSTVATGSSTSVTPAASTTYYAVVTNGVCTTTAPIVVDVANVNAGADVNLCPAGQSTALNAVYTGPPPPNNCNAYTQASIPFAPVAGVGTTLALGDDQVSGGIAIGFPFTFFCNSYSTVYVSSNGFLSFDAASPSGCCSGQILPDPNTPNNVIAAVWDDLYPPGAGNVHTQTVGVAPNRRFVLTYNGIPTCCGSTPEVTTQIILYETTHVIEIHSTSITNASPGTMGIENATGTTAFVVAGRNSSTWTASNEAWRFTPVVNAITYAWSPATYLSSTTVNNPNANAVLSTVTYTVSVNNGTCVMTDQVTVNVCPLVDRLHLQAEKDGDLVHLDWDADNEYNLARYDIERSSDGSTWEKIGEAPALNLPVTTQYYQRDDLAPMPGSNIYRIRAVDLDGITTYSNTAEVNFAAVDWLSVTPNPSSGLFQFDCSLAQSGVLEIELYAADGKRVRVIRLEDLPIGRHVEPIDLRGLPAGAYLYAVKTAQGRATGRLIKVD